MNTLQSSARGGDDLSSRLIQQGAQYFSANEGDTESEEDEERSTLRADQYVTDPDQPKLALAEDSVHPPPLTDKHPPAQSEEFRGKTYHSSYRDRSDINTETNGLILVSGRVSLYSSPDTIV